MIIKRIFGAFTCALVVFLVGFTFLHPLTSKSGSFKWQFLLALPLYALFWAYGYAWMRNYYDMNLIAIDEKNPHVKRAAELARASLQKLISALSEPKNPCFIKAGLKTKSGSIEHIWCEAHSFKDNTIWCSIANQPVDLEEHYLNERFPVAPTDIEDYVVTGRTPILGGYSVMACAQTLLDQGYNLTTKQKKLLQEHSAYLEWGFQVS